MKQLLFTLVILTLVITVLTSGIYADLYHRAPDVLPGTLQEMRTASYWIKQMENPDEVILSLDEIKRRNEAYQKKMRSPDPFKGVSEARMPCPYFYPGLVLYVPDLHSMNPEVVADTVKTRIQLQIDYLKSREWGNIFAVKYSDREIDTFIEELALDQVKDRIFIQGGITVRTSRLRNVASFATLEVGTGDSGSHRWDRWSIGLLKIGRPVTVLHTSRTGENMLVLSDLGYGWIRSENIAFGDRDKIDEFANAEDFVMCTGDRVQFYSDKNCRYSSGWFMMSDRLPIASKSNPRLVKVPVRKINGEFTTEVAWLTEDADVHVGYLSYTRRNIVVTAFRLLDNPYDFTGAWFGRQHETTYRDVFCCFGFNLPYRDALFTFYGDDETVLLPEEEKEVKYKAILKHEPFVTLQSCGRHAQLLLGVYNGEPIVFDQHGYGYEDENGTWLEVMRCSIGTLMLPKYFLDMNVTFLELK